MEKPNVREIINRALKDGPGLNTSHKFGHLDSKEIVSFYESKGLIPVKFDLSGLIKNPELRQGFQKHVIKMRLPDKYAIEDRGQLAIPELVFVNSYEGTSSLKFYLGLGVQICTNGLIVSSQMFDTRRLVHLKGSVNQLQSILDNVLVSAENLGTKINQFKAIELSEHQAIEFARSVFMNCLGVETIDKLVLTEPNSLLKTHRPDDKGPDLWRALNVIQENVLGGGGKYQIWSKNKQGHPIPRNQTLKAIKSPISRIKINQLVWSLAESFIK